MIVGRVKQLCRAASLALVVAGAASAQATPDAQARTRVEQVAADLAAELAKFCPAADPGDQGAFDRCRRALFRDSQLKRSLPDYVLWGRQRDPKALLKNTNLTQFAPDVLSGLYLPLFMFNGKYAVEYNETEGLYLIRLQTAFRNRLAPGQFPYPFWHEENKWASYQKANEVLLWWDGATNRIKIAQFTALGATEPIVKSQPVARAHDGKWLWTDENGRTQPQVTVFDGMFDRDNPYIAKLDVAYKNLALKLREGQCDQCHVPNNPDHMKKLVLLQTPAHAAGEIKRLMKSVRENKMPLDEFGIEKPLDPQTKSALLEQGGVFEKLLDAARDWEAAAAQARTAR